jgi:DNA-binding transcriptional LysR family regulator
MMDRFRELSAFLTVADERAFNAAARKLGLSASSVTRLINALEARIGARLFTRTTRSLALTEAGVRLRDEAERILPALDAAEASAAGAHQTPAGLLRITAPVLFGQMHVAPIVRDYLDLYPAVSASLVLLDRLVNLIEEGIDIALRIGELPDSSLSAVRIGELRYVIVASPAYIAEHGEPAAPKDLAGHRPIVSGDLHDHHEWSFHQNGRVITARIAPRFSVSGLTAAIDAALAGWGVARVLSYQVAGHLADGRLKEILPGADDRRLPVHLLHAEGSRAAAKTRAFIDLAAERLRASAAQLAAI